MMIDTASLDSLLQRLAQSSFRSRFKLNNKDLNYLQNKGLAIIQQHAADFIKKRLAPANPTNDGKQTPWQGHPVFVAQHATATCCRGCLQKWHKIPLNKELSAEQQYYVITVISHWLMRQNK